MNIDDLPKVNSPFILIKFGELEHLEDLQKTGHLYCNTLHKFPKIEDNYLRGDPDETVMKYTQAVPGSILSLIAAEGEFKGKEIKIKLNKGLTKDRVESPWGNLFCMYTIDVKSQPVGYCYTIHPECKRFGSHFLFVYDTERFLERLDKEVKRRDLAHIRGQVKYMDMGLFDGDRNILVKDEKYSYQQEYRIFFENDNFNPFHVHLGSLEDISTIYSVADLDHFTLVAVYPSQLIRLPNGTCQIKKLKEEVGTDEPLILCIKVSS